MTTNYGPALLSAVLITFLLILPGLYWNSVAREDRRLRSALIPVPGLLLLASEGLLLWSAGPTHSFFVAVLTVLPHLAMTVHLAWHIRDPRRLRASLGEQGPAVFAAWGGVFLTAMAVGFNPLPVDQEYPSGTTLPARMVASPDDHTIPYTTSVYFYHGKDGKESSEDYFGDWSVASRGPLVPLAVNTLLHILRAKPSDPPDTTATAWPITKEGAYAARIFGWLTNAMVVLGVAHLLTVLGIARSGRRIALVWTALAPVTLINTVFLWPKLLAAFFILLASASILESCWVLAALWTALAWLSHPVGALFLPALGLLLTWQAQRGSRGIATKFRAIFIAGATFAIAGAAVMGPWLGYKAWLGYHDAFMDYFLANGEMHRAETFQAWADARWRNFWLTLVPGGFFLNGEMPEWLEGPLTGPMRWTVQYAKTLPAGLGFSLFGAAYVAFLRRNEDPRVQALKFALVGASFATMIVFWGYSEDGLGRNCLEPLEFLMIVLGVASFPSPSILWWLGLVGVYLEGRWVEFSGFVGVPGFHWSAVPVAAWIACGASSAIGLCYLAWAARDFPFAGGIRLVGRPEALAVDRSVPHDAAA